MEKEQAWAKKTGPIIIETSGVRIWVDCRRGAIGNDGITFDINAAGQDDEEARILRFDCFHKKPHYHLGKNLGHPMKEEPIENSVRWTLEQLKTRLPAMVAEAGYETLAATIDQAAVAQSLSRAEEKILAKIDASRAMQY